MSANIRVNGYEFTGESIAIPTGFMDEVEGQFKLTPKGQIPADHPARKDPMLKKWGRNYTFYEGQEIWGIGKESVEVVWLN